MMVQQEHRLNLRRIDWLVEKSQVKAWFGWLASLMLDLITGQQRVFPYRYGSFLVKTRRAHIILIRPMSSDGCAQNSRAEFRDRQAAWERVVRPAVSRGR